MKNKISELKIEDLTKYEYYLTVGELRKTLSEYPDDAKVLVQRVEDCYYEGMKIDETRSTEGWPVVLKKGAAYHHAIDWNKEMHDEVLRKIAGEKPEYAFDDPQNRMFTKEQIESMMEQYTPAFSVIKYKDDPNNLYIDLHY